MDACGENSAKSTERKLITFSYFAELYALWSHGIKVALGDRKLHELCDV